MKKIYMVLVCSLFLSILLAGATFTSKKQVSFDVSSKKKSVQELIFPIDLRDCIVRNNKVELTGWFNEKRWYGLHRAYDIPVIEDTQIRMPADGRVSKIYSFGHPRCSEGVWRSGYGIYMEIEFQYLGEKITMLFAHLNKILVLEGSYLKQGDIIALSGSTGLVNTKGVFRPAPHVHIEIYKNSTKVPFHRELGEAVKKELKTEENLYAFTLRTPAGTNN
jgi:murein DD-endopeptidase MepM/ murein hydrolase activator NlpD